MPSPDSTGKIDRQLSARELAGRFLENRIDYERIARVPYRPQQFKLRRMHELLRRLGDPQRSMPIIHIAGTKGKGSTAAMIGAVLSAAGYRTGVFTSPHLERIEERFAIDGSPCSSAELVELVGQFRPVVEAMDRDAAASKDIDDRPTYFEVTTAMALVHFARRGADAAVLEVGLGGRLDSTNVCDPQVSVITSISFDHTRQLGNTLESIAREKAGIVKAGVPVVSGVVDPAPREVICRVCRRRRCRLVELGTDFDFDYVPPRRLDQGPALGKLGFHYRVNGRHYRYRALSLRLFGWHQAVNAAVALATLVELRQTGWEIPEEAIRAGLAGLAWPARVELVARRPSVVVDAAHNVASVEALIRVLHESFSARRRRLLFASTQDKDVAGMLRKLLDHFDETIFTQYVNNPRAIGPEQLEAMAAELTGRRYAVFSSPADAWEQVRSGAAPDDLVCVTGSFFIAAEIRQLIRSRPLPPPAELYLQGE